MSLTASLNNHRLTKARVNLGAWGCWYADAELDGDHTLTGACELKVSDLTLNGTILNGGPKKGRSTFRIVAGAAGWGTVIDHKDYGSDLGVKMSTVLRDAATAAKEQIVITSDAAIGPKFVRQEGPAARVLEQLVPGNWYVDELGVTRVGKRPALPYTLAATRVVPADLAQRTVTLAPDSIKTLLPGAVVDGIEAVDVQHDIGPKGLRSTIWGKLSKQDSTSRRLERFRKLLLQALPFLPFCALWEYRVVTQEGDRVNLQPVTVSSGMPTLLRVPVRPGVPGCAAELLPASRVVVGFLNMSASRPIVVAFEDWDGEGFKPLVLELDAATLLKLGAGLRPAIGAGDLAGGLFPVAPTQVKVLI